MALEVRVLGLEDKVSTKSFFRDFLHSHFINLQRVKGRFLLFVSFDFLPKKGRKIEGNWLTEQSYHRGAII